MSMLALNTLAYAKKLIAAGVPERQAEAQAEALAEIVEDTLATKLDIKELETTLRRDMKDLEYRMVIKLGALMVVAVSAVATLQKVL